MPSASSVEIADYLSRRRAIGVAVAAGAFLVVQVIARPFLPRGSAAASHLQPIAWAVNVAALLLILATGGGLLCRPDLRGLVHDAVSRQNMRTAICLGYWIAMAGGMGLYAAAGPLHVTAREAIYLVVSTSTAAALLAFAYLELRAHREA